MMGIKIFVSLVIVSLLFLEDFGSILLTIFFDELNLLNMDLFTMD